MRSPPRRQRLNLSAASGAASNTAPVPERGTCDGLSFGPSAHRGGEPGEVDGWTRRSESGKVPCAIDVRPVISSPCTVNSPSRGPFCSLKVNRSPATVPSTCSLLSEIASPLLPAPEPFTRTDPLTFEPSCSKSNRRVKLWFPCPAEPYQAPVTSTVTSVRSIQSVLAQPEPPKTKAVATSTRTMVLISSPGW
jgi:hypothetical protein